MDFIEVRGYKIRVKSARNFRNLALKMAPGKGVWVNIPYGCSWDQVVGFIEKNIDWIEKNQTKCETRAAESLYSVGDKIKTRFNYIELAEHSGASFEMRKSGNEIKLYAPSPVHRELLTKVAKRLMVEVMRRECMTILPMRVKSIADRCGFKYGKLSFRNNSSNWGSCSGNNNISLNVKLMLARDEVIDYVIIHELCHTKVKNHSDEFWQLVKRFCPDYEALRKELKSIK